MSPDIVGHEIYIFDRTCRMCTSNFEPKNLFSLFPNEEQLFSQPPLDFIKKYVDLMNFEIEDNEELPTQICRSCYNTFETFHNFMATCETSNTILTNYFKFSKPPKQELAIWNDTITVEEKIKIDFCEDQTNIKGEINDDVDEQISEYEIIEDYGDVEVIDEINDTSNDQDEYQNSISDNSIQKDYEFLSCDLCKNSDIKFKTKIILGQHIEKYHPVSCPYLCLKCFRNFRSEKILLKHNELSICQENHEKLLEMENDSKDNLLMEEDDFENFDEEVIYFTENIDDQEYKDEKNNSNDSTDTKIIRHGKRKKYDCPECSDIFKDVKKFKKHIKSEHPEFDSKLIFRNSRYLCDVCGKDLKEQSLLEDHIYMHKGLKPYVCSLCEAAFNNRKLFAMHVRDHADGPYQCELCDKEYEKKKTLTNHLKWHEKQKEPETRHKCPFCSRYFTTLSTLTLHAARHRKPTETKHICPECNAPFKRADHLKMHIDGVHLKNTPFPCSECKKAFCTSWQRNIHVKQYHSGKNVVKCSFCDKQYHSINSLRRHEKIHTGEMIYQCEICSKKFISIPLLKNHLKIHKIDEVEKQNIISETYEQLTNNCLITE